MKLHRLSFTLLVFCLFVFAGVGSANAQSNCPGASPLDNTPDDAAIQACLDGGGTITLDPGEPGYIIRSGLRLRHAGTVLMTSQWGNWAHLKAHPDLGSDGPDEGRMIITENLSFINNWELAYIWLDGNGPNRTAHSWGCNGPGSYRPRGINATLKGSNFVIRFSRFTDAMCGSGLEVSGSNYEIYQNYFAANGRDYNSEWADGLTLLSCNGGNVHDNDFLDNTDVSIVLFSSNGGCQIRWNLIENYNRYSFAGMAVGDGSTNNSGGSISNNEIGASNNRMLFGINVGGQWWTGGVVMVPNIGEVVGNRVTGAYANLVVDGLQNGVFIDNVSQSPQGSSPTCFGPQHYTAAYIGGGVTLQPGWTSLTWLGGTCHVP